MTPLTVACLFVRGEYPYTVEYVRCLRAGVARHLSRPFRFVCLTDQPEAMPEGVEAIPIQKLAGFAFWSKLHMFNPALGLTGRVLYLDLDTLIVGDLDPIVDAPAPFTCAADLFGNGDGPPVFGVKSGRLVRAKHQGSVIAWTAGCGEHNLFFGWAPDVSASYYGCDDWISATYPTAPVLPLEWFPRIGQIDGAILSEAKVMLVKKPKNHIAAERWPWFAEMWRAE